MSRSSLPLRRCVGVALFNSKGLVFVGRRRSQGAEPDSMPHRWQMPQGGIDRDEEPIDAARRELKEETGVHSIELLGEAPDWFDYLFPPEILARTRNGKYGGQTQLWFAFRFLGDDSEINLSPPGHKPEFDAWRWAPLAETPSLIVPFKRDVYSQVTKAFARYAG
ncbi:RNA pyrophosphohydrolase [Chelatococcus sambhunathii]|uniref:RNA pyrophosphohydrolase n=1 Tax=Chelatococcus sambhunathii TaxID=363953 RepID=A0ABU1DF74_9HYPH|nr:RNA pyrophosphohydrolase [Chelatococcus sambhunathii]MDR4306752.1 RNA pyrophosphohydrolase [Chelatococcus sambhunathii]